MCKAPLCQTGHVAGIHAIGPQKLRSVDLAISIPTKLAREHKRPQTTTTERIHAHALTADHSHAQGARLGRLARLLQRHGAC